MEKRYQIYEPMEPLSQIYLDFLNENRALPLNKESYLGRITKSLMTSGKEVIKEGARISKRGLESLAEMQACKVNDEVTKRAFILSALAYAALC